MWAEFPQPEIAGQEDAPGRPDDEQGEVLGWRMRISTWDPHWSTQPPARWNIDRKLLRDLRHEYPDPPPDEEDDGSSQDARDGVKARAPRPSWGTCWCIQPPARRPQPGWDPGSLGQHHRQDAIPAAASDYKDDDTDNAYTIDDTATTHYFFLIPGWSMPI